MRKFLGLYETESAYRADLASGLDLPNVSYAKDVRKVFYNPAPSWAFRIDINRLDDTNYKLL